MCHSISTYLNAAEAGLVPDDEVILLLKAALTSAETVMWRDLTTKETEVAYEEIKMTCPECGSKDTTETVRTEHCNSCGWSMYYGDAHASGEAQLSKETHGNKYNNN